MPRPGFVLDVDRSTPPILFHHGEGFRLERLPRRPQPHRLPARAARRPSRRRRRHPPGAARAAGRPEAARRAAPTGHEADDRVRRHLAAAAADAPSRHPPAGDRGGARPGCGRGRRRHPPHRRPRPPPPHDRGRAAPRHRRPGLRRLRPPRPPLQPRRRGSRTSSHLGTTEPGEEVEINKRAAESRPARLRQHQPRVDGRRLEVDRHRAGVVPEPPPPPQRAHAPGLPQPHGPPALRAPPRPTGAWARCITDAGVNVFQIETTLNTDTFPEAVRLPDEAGVGVVAPGPGRLRRHPEVAEPARPTGWPAASSSRCERPTA